MRGGAIVVLSALLLCAGCNESTGQDQAELRALLDKVATAWSAGDARAAADLFTEDAIYSEPPDKQLYRGREALFQFFGGESGRAGDMRMEWHNVAYNAETGVGFGEFSFTFGSTAHGIVAVKVDGGKISNWREFWYESELDWDEFVSSNPF